MLYKERYGRRERFYILHRTSRLTFQLHTVVRTDTTFPNVCVNMRPPARLLGSPGGFARIIVVFKYYLFGKKLGCVSRVYFCHGESLGVLIFGLGVFTCCGAELLSLVYKQTRWEVSFGSFGIIAGPRKHFQPNVALFHFVRITEQALIFESYFVLWAQLDATSAGSETGLVRIYEVFIFGGCLALCVLRVV